MVEKEALIYVLDHAGFGVLSFKLKFKGIKEIEKNLPGRSNWKEIAEDLAKYEANWLRYARTREKILETINALVYYYYFGKKYDYPYFGLGSLL